MIENRVYPNNVRDEKMLEHLDETIKAPQFKELYDIQVEPVDLEVIRTLVGFAMSSVRSDLDPVLDDWVTKGGHAEGRSLSDGVTGEDMMADKAEGVDYYVRPNGEKYFVRNWGETLTEVEVLIKAREAMHFPLLFGPPGTGKTAMTEAAYGEDLITVLGTGDTELADLVGGYIPTPEGQYLWVDGPLIQAAIEGRPILLDEIGIIDPKVLTAVYGLMDGRREYRITANPNRGTVKAKDGFFVIGATNPNAPGVRLSEALLSRFTLHVEVMTDFPMAQRLGVDPLMVKAAKHMDGQMRLGQGIGWAPQFRELLAYRDVEKMFGKQFAIENLIASAPELERGQVIDIMKTIFGVRYESAAIKS